ncbi:MAG: hypothetical protein ABJN43_19095, partial [Sneathiella sp.]
YELDRTFYQVLQDFKWCMVNSLPWAVVEEEDESGSHPPKTVSEKGKTREPDLKKAKGKSASKERSNIKLISFDCFKESSICAEKNLQRNIDGQDALQKLGPEIARQVDCHHPGLLVSDLIRKIFTACYRASGLKVSKQGTVPEVQLNSLRTGEAYFKFVDLILQMTDRQLFEIREGQPDFLQSCSFEAVNDLVLGKLHRLDPVIEDAGCQWRVPFIVDLHRFVAKKFPKEVCEEAIREYETALAENGRLSTMHYMNEGGAKEYQANIELIRRTKSASSSAAAQLKDVTRECRRIKTLIKEKKEAQKKYNYEINRLKKSDEEGEGSVDASEQLRTYRALAEQVILKISILERKLEEKEAEKTGPQKEADRLQKLIEKYTRKLLTKKEVLDKVKWTGDMYEVLDFEKLPSIQPPEKYLAFFKRVCLLIDSAKVGNVIGFTSDRSDMPLNEVWRTVMGDPNHYLNSKKERRRPAHLSTVRYLTLCKALTVRQLRFMDRFCISGGKISLTLPYVSEQDMSEAKAEVAWYSRAYLIDAFSMMVAAEENQALLRDGLDEEGGPCMAEQLVRALQGAKWYYKCSMVFAPTMAYYENKRLMYMYCFLKGIPLLIDMRRLRYIEGEEGEKTYTYLGGDIFYFNPDPDAKRFMLIPKEDLTDVQKNIPAFMFECYSMTNSRDTVPSEEMPYVHDDFDVFAANYFSVMDPIDQFQVINFSHAMAPNSTVATKAEVERILSARTEMKRPEKELPDFVKMTKEYWEGALAMGGSHPAGETLDKLDLVGNNLAFNARESRGCLSVFGNIYQGTPWSILAERQLADQVEVDHDYKGYQYRSAGRNDHAASTRAKGCYPLATIHIYGCTYAQKKAQNEIFEDEWLADTLDTDLIEMSEGSVRPLLY